MKRVGFKWGNYNEAVYREAVRRSAWMDRVASMAETARFCRDDIRGVTIDVS